MWQSIEAAAREWDVVLVSLCAPEESAAPDPPAARAPGLRVMRVPHRPPPAPVALLRGLAGRWPYTLARFRSAALDQAVRAAVAEHRPAYALTQCLHTATVVDALGGTPMVLREQNLEHVWMARYAASAPAPVAAYARLQAARLRGAEAALVRRAALTLAIQDGERDALRALCPGARVETVPVGMDFGAVLPREPVDPPVVLLSGSYAWPPNVDGAMAFLRSGWPRVSAAVPRARLRLAGKGIPDALRAAAVAAGAEVAGYVPAMLEECRRAAVLAIPLWVGAGARVKAVEAMAAGLPIASTPLGVEGLGLAAGRHFISGETPETLGDAVAAILASTDRGDAMAEAARGHASSRFSLESVARLQNQLCGSVAR
jgi:glycosyltransferase involved in cell wall biosynthesis